MRAPDRPALGLGAVPTTLIWLRPPYTSPAKERKENVGFIVAIYLEDGVEF